MRVAVIDIGSNAIRAAIYDSNQLGASEIFNEKFKSDLTSLLELESIDVKHGTYNTFSYFKNVFEKLNVSKIACVATEVLRNHSKANVFVKEIKTRFNIEIKILSGEEEARITAEGLMSSMPNAAGIAADLGGGSLELAEIYDKKVHSVKSLALGTKAISKLQITDPGYISSSIEKEFSSVNSDNIYLIGGSLRLLGRCYMDYNKNVIKNLHNLVIDPEEFIKFLEELQTLQRFQRFIQQYKINKQAIIVTNGLINHFRPKKLIISTFGLKEGVRFGILSDEEKRKDISLERCLDFARPLLASVSVDKYVHLYESLFNDRSVIYNRLFVKALILSQCTRHIDRNYRADWVINFILTTDIPLDQIERAILIVALANTLSGKINIIPKPIKGILSKEQNGFAQSIGALIKIAILVDGPILTSPSFKINTKDKFLEIVTENILPKNIFDKICEQLKTIGIYRKSVSPRD